jgi:hypothetical protein
MLEMLFQRAVVHGVIFGERGNGEKQDTVKHGWLLLFMRQ